MDAAQLLHQTMDLALQCHRAKDWEQAAMLYQVALRLLPDHADANHNLGAILVEQGSPLTLSLSSRRHCKPTPGLPLLGQSGGCIDVGQ